MPPLVSVVIPAYNAGPYVEAAIRSMREQTYTNLEIIVVDDGSTDDTWEAISRQVAEDPRVRAVQQANGGPAVAFNTGFAMARGEYIAKMDADDLSLPVRIARQVDFLERHPDYVVVGARMVLTDPELRPKRMWCNWFKHEECDRHQLEGRGGGIGNCVAVVRRSAMQRIGGARPEFRKIDDFDQFVRLAEIGRIANLHDVLHVYRVLPGSYSSQHTVANKWPEKILVLQQTIERRGLSIPELKFVPPRSLTAGEKLRDESLVELAWGNRRKALKLALRAVLAEPTAPWAMHLVRTVLDRRPEANIHVLIARHRAPPGQVVHAGPLSRI
jgi:glycosyltransferase involved in cell wall biosynthesis